VRQDRRDLGDLVHLRVRVGNLGQRLPAVFTLGRVEVDDVVDLSFGHELAATTSMTTLSAALALDLL
jgi:hypothetical protein